MVLVILFDTNHSCKILPTINFIIDNEQTLISIYLGMLHLAEILITDSIYSARTVLSYSLAKILSGLVLLSIMCQEA